MSEPFQIITSIAQQTEVYSRLDEQGKANWSLLFENPQRPVFTDEQLRLIKGEQK